MDEATGRVLAAVREGTESWNEGLLDAALEIWHDDMVWVEADAYPDGGTRVGRDACVARMRQRLEMLGGVQIEIVAGELRGRQLLVEVRGAGATSGAPAENREYWIYEFAEDGRFIRWLEFLDRGAAEAAFADADQYR